MLDNTEQLHRIWVAKGRRVTCHNPIQLLSEKTPAGRGWLHVDVSAPALTGADLTRERARVRIASSIKSRKTKRDVYLRGHTIRDQGKPSDPGGPDLQHALGLPRALQKQAWLTGSHYMFCIPQKLEKPETVFQWFRFSPKM